MPQEVLRLGIDSSAAVAGQRQFAQASERTNQALKATSLALAATSAASLALGRDYDNARKTIVQGTGATGKALDGLLGSFRNLSGTVTGDVAGAIADVNTHFGVTGTELESLAMKTLQAQQAFGSFDIGQFGEAMKSFNLDARESGPLLDHLGTVAQDTGLNMGTLVSNVRDFGPVARNLGLSAAETATFFGKLNEAGVSVTRVMPGLNAAMRRAASEGVTDLRGHLDSAIESIRAASTDTEALSLATETFGAEGAQRMVSAIRSGVLPSLSQLSSVYGDTAGRTEEAYSATLTLADRFQLLRGRLVGFAGPAANTVGVLGSIGAALAGVVPILPRLALAFRGLWAAITGPVGLVTTAVFALGAAFYAFRRQIGNVLASMVRDFAEWGDLLLQAADKALGWIPGFGPKIETARAAFANFANDAAYWADGLGESTQEAAEGAERLGFGAVQAAGDLGVLTAAQKSAAETAAEAAEEMERAAGVVEELAPRTQKTSRQIEVMGRELNALRPHALGAAEALLPLRTQTRELPTVFQTAWDNIRSVFTSDSLANAVNSIFGGGDIRRALAEQGKAAADLLGNAFAAALSAVPVVGQFLSKLGPALGQGITSLAGKIGGFFKGLFGGGVSEAEKAAREMAAAHEEEARKAAEAWQDAMDSATSAFSSAYGSAREAARAAYEAAYVAAIESGKGQAEAAGIASNAQINAYLDVTVAARERYVQEAALEAALLAIRQGNAAGAVAAARMAAEEAGRAWDAVANALFDYYTNSGDRANDAADAAEAAHQRIADSAKAAAASAAADAAASAAAQEEAARQAAEAQKMAAEEAAAAWQRAMDAAVSAATSAFQSAQTAGEQAYQSVIDESKRTEESLRSDAASTGMAAQEAFDAMGQAWLAYQTAKAAADAEGTASAIAEAERAHQAALAAQQRFLTAQEIAVRAGVALSQHEADTKINLTNEAEAARQAAIAETLAAERDRYVRVAAFEAALEAIRSGNVSGAAEAARRAAQETGQAWDIAIGQVQLADEAANQAMQDNAAETGQAQQDAASDASQAQQDAATDAATAWGMANTAIREGAAESGEVLRTLWEGAAMGAEETAERAVQAWRVTLEALGMAARETLNIYKAAAQEAQEATKRATNSMLDGFRQVRAAVASVAGAFGAIPPAAERAADAAGSAAAQMTASFSAAASAAAGIASALYSIPTEVTSTVTINTVRQESVVRTVSEVTEPSAPPPSTPPTTPTTPTGGGLSIPGGGRFTNPRQAPGGLGRTGLSFQGGSGGIRDFGRGTLARLHGREAVVTDDQIERMIAAAAFGGAVAARPPEDGSGGDSVTWNLQPGAIVIQTEETDGEKILEEVDRAMRERASGTGPAFGLT